MDYTPEQIAALEAKAAKLEALETELATVKRSAAFASKFAALKDKATNLRNAGKLTPAKFKELGFEDAETSIATFSAGDDLALAKLEIQLDTIEEFAQPVKFGSHLADEPIPGNEDADNADLDKEIEAFFAAHKSKRTW